ncbi:unnamed protein product [Amoebophrya sp. A25]|nr:unnamed protein product [Amoebophrya sp. A25]|eukprot:GSA25T00001496001.1
MASVREEFQKAYENREKPAEAVLHKALSWLREKVAFKVFAERLEKMASENAADIQPQEYLDALVTLNNVVEIMFEWTKTKQHLVRTINFEIFWEEDKIITREEKKTVQLYFATLLDSAMLIPGIIRDSGAVQKAVSVRDRLRSILVQYAGTYEDRARVFAKAYSDFNDGKHIEKQLEYNGAKAVSQYNLLGKNIGAKLDAAIEAAPKTTPPDTIVAQVKEQFKAMWAAVSPSAEQRDTPEDAATVKEVVHEVLAWAGQDSVLGPVPQGRFRNRVIFLQGRVDAEHTEYSQEYSDLIDILHIVVQMILGCTTGTLLGCPNLEGEDWKRLVEYMKLLMGAARVHAENSQRGIIRSTTNLAQVSSVIYLLETATASSDASVNGASEEVKKLEQKKLAALFDVTESAELLVPSSFYRRNTIAESLQDLRRILDRERGKGIHAESRKLAQKVKSNFESLRDVCVNVNSAVKEIGGWDNKSPWSIQKVLDGHVAIKGQYTEASAMLSLGNGVENIANQDKFFKRLKELSGLSRDEAKKHGLEYLDLTRALHILVELIDECTPMMKRIQDESSWHPRDSNLQALAFPWESVKRYYDKLMSAALEPIPATGLIRPEPTVELAKAREDLQGAVWKRFELYFDEEKQPDKIIKTKFAESDARTKEPQVDAYGNVETLSIPNRELSVNRLPLIYTALGKAIDAGIVAYVKDKFQGAYAHLFNRGNEDANAWNDLHREDVQTAFQVRLGELRKFSYAEAKAHRQEYSDLLQVLLLSVELIRKCGSSVKDDEATECGQAVLGKEKGAQGAIMPYYRWIIEAAVSNPVAGILKPTVNVPNSPSYRYAQEVAEGLDSVSQPETMILLVGHHNHKEKAGGGHTGQARNTLSDLFKKQELGRGELQRDFQETKDALRKAIQADGGIVAQTRSNFEALEFVLSAAPAKNERVYGLLNWATAKGNEFSNRLKVLQGPSDAGGNNHGDEYRDCVGLLRTLILIIHGCDGANSVVRLSETVEAYYTMLMNAALFWNFDPGEKGIIRPSSIEEARRVHGLVATDEQNWGLISKCRQTVLYNNKGITIWQTNGVSKPRTSSDPKKSQRATDIKSELNNRIGQAERLGLTKAHPQGSQRRWL